MVHKVTPPPIALFGIPAAKPAFRLVDRSAPLIDVPIMSTYENLTWHET